MFIILPDSDPGQNSPCDIPAFYSRRKYHLDSDSEYNKPIEFASGFFIQNYNEFISLSLKCHVDL